MSYFDPIALHRKNNANLGEYDILIPAYPGSGHALIGNILLELGLDYFDPYTERVTETGSSQPVKERIAYRSRLAASAKHDQLIHSCIPTGVHLRFVKTHLMPEEFSACKLGGIILLVRDPRDAIHSYYHWRLGFSEEGESGTFFEFLNRPGFNGVTPCVDWATFYQCWFEYLDGQSRVIITHFESLKQNGMVEMSRLLDTFLIKRSPEAIKRALESSSFEVMRVHEDQIAEGQGAQRIMRRGCVNEWKEWFSSEHWSFFNGTEILSTAKILGYKLSTPI